MTPLTLADLPSRVGSELFRSDWLPLDAADEAAFGAATFLRADFLGRPPSTGGTMISGFLLLSLVAAFHKRDLALERDGVYGLNYGLDRVRFLRPVRAGQRVRMSAVLLDVAEKEPGRTRVLTRNTLEAEGAEGPAMVADWIAYYVAPDGG
ncbi:MaoC/PaaZ C-terminal domain-containing protein [Actinomadura parmotrematis]|uniref:MaoC family dehydratase n=1 Tax=Actinomadura parmotrematis TaxID=2864039 RepID=A0ABS7FXI7_9ACTN|nr:MaoC/PaaZ C-terminal domain-containing protein [Actinomadura parmotrematis]MBW8484163.1 MaoC family dehydratase [Actinomadura parmotrematis]